MKNKVILLSMDSLEKFVSYDSLLIEPFKKAGWLATVRSWRTKDINWNDYDAVIVRSTWDYQEDPQVFLETLEKINNSSAHLENNLEIIKWNMDKKYLSELQRKGVNITETIWKNIFIPAEIIDCFEALKSDEIIIKPNISANADNTFRLNRENINDQIIHLEKIFKHRQFMVQAFNANVINEGEYSLFYFNGEYSHTILKVPGENDFRVQEEHGGIIKSISPEQGLKKSARFILECLSTIPLYARIDLARGSDNKFDLMELELIEPSLYFNMDKESAERFVKAFVKKFNDKN